MLSLSRLAALVVPVQDLDQAVDFYERRLRLPRTRVTSTEVRLSAGGVELWLRPAASDRPSQDSCEPVFLVDDLPTTCRSLTRRGVPPTAARRHDIGTVAAFRDPSGHRLTLYQASPAALAGPGGPLLREVWRAHGHGGDPHTPPPGPLPHRPGLAGNPLAALIVPERTRQDAQDFCYTNLGLALLGRAGTLSAYDAGWVLLVTRSSGSPSGKGSITPVYEVTESERLSAELSARLLPSVPNGAPNAPFYLLDAGSPAYDEPVLPAFHR